jgi:hypothetical protein
MNRPEFYNYYAFGGLQPYRYYNNPGYSFAFNGQFKNDDWLGDGTYNHALFWEYNNRLGVRMNKDPKPSASECIYSCFSGNPILNVDILGDSEYTVFYDQNGHQTNNIPAALEFQSENEYGTKLGYNSNTHMLYDAGHVDTRSKKSQTAQDEWRCMLGPGHAFGKMVIGYNLYRQGTGRAINFGEYQDESTEPDFQTTYLDLGDFDEKGKAVGFIQFRNDPWRPGTPDPDRTFNLARVWEHEYIGHGLLGFVDLQRQGIPEPGEVERNFSNKIRNEIQLPVRLKYGAKEFKHGQSDAYIQMFFDGAELSSYESVIDRKTKAVPGR